MAEEGKRIPELSKAASSAKDGVYAIYDPNTNKTVQIDIQSGLGAVRANMDWQADASYSIGDLVLFNLLAWKSLQNTSIGNIPTENTFWTEVPISAADGITDTQWSAGVFTYNDSKVVYNNAQYYLQDTAPFESTDFDAELTAGNWASPDLGALDNLQFTNQVTPPAYSSGLMWFSGDHFNFYDNIPGTSIQLGEELFVHVYNNNGSTLTNFTAVRYGPSVGGIPAAVRAQADTVSNARSFGVCTHDILVGEVGKVTTFGPTGGDTSMWNDNDRLWLSATVAGELTNIEQPILKPIGRVLVSDTEANGGKIYVFQQEAINVTALGQAVGSNQTQLLGITPEPLEVYNVGGFEKNVTLTQTGGGPATAIMSPASIGASGYYRISFNITITSDNNRIHIFEVYINGSPTGLLTAIDLQNNNIDSGNGSFSAITQSIITNTDTIEIYASISANTATITVASLALNIERIGTV